MTRSLCVLPALMLAYTTLAAPAPQPKPFVSGWGKPVDPDRDCKFTRDKGALIIEIPGSNHEYNPRRGELNAPRLFRERDIEGDFAKQVRVQIDCRPSIQSTVEGQPTFVATGFLVILPDHASLACIRMEFGVSRKDSGEDRYAALIKWNHEKVQGGPFFLENGWKREAYLKLERQGGDLTFSISLDGEKWKGLGVTVGIREKLKVGLAAYSTSTEPSKVRFDQLKLKRGKKKER